MLGASTIRIGLGHVMLNLDYSNVGRDQKGRRLECHARDPKTYEACKARIKSARPRKPSKNRQKRHEIFPKNPIETDETLKPL